MSNTIVKEIHSSFTTAEAELIEEAESILQDAENKEKKERASELAKLGFTSAKPVEKMSKENQQRAKDLLHLKKRYDRVAPQYRFLTETKLIEICEKYGIVVGSAERYTGDIPETNQQHLLDFKLLDDSFLEINDEAYREARHHPKEGGPIHPKDMSTEHIFNTMRMWANRFGSRDQYGSYMSKSDVPDVQPDLVRAMVTELHLRGDSEQIDDLRSLFSRIPALSKGQVDQVFTPYKTTYFYVAADVDSFDTTGTSLEDNMLVEENNDQELSESIKDSLFREYDPIVLAKVQGGYLVVTAWGDEASDPDVINPKNN